MKPRINWKRVWAEMHRLFDNNDRPASEIQRTIQRIVNAELRGKAKKGKGK